MARQFKEFLSLKQKINIKMATPEKSKIEEIIGKSGNNFHSRVVNLLRSDRWTVLVSPFYSDNFTDKPREIDIVAEKKFNVEEYGHWFGTVNVRLFIECKYINDSMVFWFDMKEKEKAKERIMMDMKIKHPNELNIQKLHYFSDAPVAKMSASSKRLGDENDVINKAINQSLNAMVYYRHKQRLFSPEKNIRENVLQFISYPIIVCNSFQDLYRTNVADNSNASDKISEPFQIEVNYAYMDKDKNSQNEYFLIDVVSIDTLSNFLSMLEKTDMEELKIKINLDEITKQSPRKTN